MTNDNLLLITCESYANYNNKRAFRFVVFDVFGDVVFRGDDNDTSGFYNKKYAEKAFKEWYSSFDVLSHYRESIYRKYIECTNKSNELASLLNCFE